MAKRRTIGENPLDLLIPSPSEAVAAPASLPARGGGGDPREEVVGGGPPAKPAREPAAPEPTRPAAPAEPAPEPKPEPGQEATSAPAAPRQPKAEPASPAARQPAAAPDGKESYLTFRIAGEEYAVRVRQAREILEYQPVTPVPTTPGWIRGVMNLRGGVVPVVDLAVKFGLAPTEVTKRTCIVVVEVDLEGEAAVMGVTAESVSQVLDLGPGAIEPAPPFGTRVHVDYLVGMTRVGERLALVLDVDRVLSAHELIAAAKAPEGAAEEAADETEGAGTEIRAEPEPQARIPPGGPSQTETAGVERAEGPHVEEIPIASTSPRPGGNDGGGASD